LAHARGAFVLVDGAHAVGQFHVDVAAIGCDFYAMVGYKWLFGPYPSAALYVGRHALDTVEVTWCGSGTTQTSSVTMYLDDLRWIPGARRFEYGGRPVAYDTAMAKGTAFVESLGIDAVRANARRLTDYLRVGLARIPGATIKSPVDPDEATGIATVALANVDGVRLAALLQERKVITRPALGGTSVRLSLAAFVEERDIDECLDVLATAAAT
jgi:selenocysteine lyase/cysteine desulfurase